MCHDDQNTDEDEYKIEEGVETETVKHLLCESNYWPDVGCFKDYKALQSGRHSDVDELSFVSRIGQLQRFTWLTV